MKRMTIKKTSRSRFTAIQKKRKNKEKKKKKKVNQAF
jgi:hypothetical protein